MLDVEILITESKLSENSTIGDFFRGFMGAIKQEKYEFHIAIVYKKTCKKTESYKKIQYTKESVNNLNKNLKKTMATNILLRENITRESKEITSLTKQIKDQKNEMECLKKRAEKMSSDLANVKSSIYILSNKYVIFPMIFLLFLTLKYCLYVLSNNY